MSNIRLFFSNTISADMSGTLNKSQSHYLINVMRFKENDVFSLFNKDGEWEAKIIKINKNIIQFKIIYQLRLKEINKELWLAFSPIKSNYQSYMFQKATELGITKFFPLIFERTIVRKMNIERFEKIVIEACEQSSRINLPSIEKPQKLDIFLKKNSANIIFTDLNSMNNKIDKSKFQDKPICIIVGPEGDFSETERETILSSQNVQAVKLNENILRSETAAISAISIVNYLII